MPVHVLYLNAADDQKHVAQLEKYAALLRRQGLISTWSPGAAAPGQDFAARVRAEIARADVLLLLLSADLVADHAEWIELALVRGKQGARVVPVLVRPLAVPEALQGVVPLPRSGKPISTYRDLDSAYLEVVEGISEIVTNLKPAAKAQNPGQLPGAFSSAAPSAPRPASSGALPQTMSAGAAAAVVPTAAASATIQDLFGDSELLFVEPEQLPKLRLYVSTLRGGLVVEGPSGIGKTTLVKKALELENVSAAKQLWLELAATAERARLPALLDLLVAGTQRDHVVLDDFHLLRDRALTQQVAETLKVLAARQPPTAKLTLIGTSPVGESVVQALPDLAGRVRIVRLGRQPDLKIQELILQGERAANVRFLRRDEIIREADGSFFIAKQLCLHIADQQGVRGAQAETVELRAGPLDVLPDIRGELDARFFSPLRALASFDEQSPPRGATLALLWLLAQSRDGLVSLEEARQRYPTLSQAFAWLMANLPRCFEQKPELQRLLYYNREGVVLSIEDPRLRFYLRSMPWLELAQRSGHALSEVTLHPVDGLLFHARRTSGGAGATSSGNPAGSAAQPAVASTAPDAQVTVLHLSDLHFDGSEGQAARWYTQLAEDLRELGQERLDALVVSGDIGSRATKEEYQEARLFLEQVQAGFGLNGSQVVLVPGNHDLSWQQSEDSYKPARRSRYNQPLREGRYIGDGEYIGVRDDAAYVQRFAAFAALYEQIRGEPYPLEPERQGTLHYLHKAGMVFLGLNSAHEIDHHFTGRAGINPDALAGALRTLQQNPAPAYLRVAVFHHPVFSSEDDRIHDPAFLQQLAKAGFRLGLHGHIHKAENQLYRRPAGGGLELVAAGTFGAVRHMVPGYPMQYNLLRVAGAQVTVETRCRREENGAWEPDARWADERGQDPRPRYVIDLKAR